jgi:hypothetical protein
LTRGNVVWTLQAIVGACSGFLCGTDARAVCSAICYDN